MPLGIPSEQQTKQTVLPLIILIASVVVSTAIGTAIYFAVTPRGSKIKSGSYLQAYKDTANVKARQDALALLEYTAAADYQRASRILREAAERGDVLSYMHWAYVQPQYLYYSDFRFPQTGRRVLAQVTRLAETGNPEAAYLVAKHEMYFEPKMDSKRVRRLLALGAEGGYVPAMTAYGYDLMEGYSGPTDLKRAESWLTQAAQSGDIGAMKQLGDLLGNPNSPNHDFKEAFKWYQRAAEKGYKGAYYAVGWCYEKGTGTLLDKAEALRWYEQGAKVHDPQALFMLGYKYVNGEGVSKDLTKARAYFEEASALGYEDATTWIETIDSGR